MDVAEAVQWWGDWQLRILVLVSLFLQYFLFITASLRKLPISPWLRFSIWFAYLGSDAIALYALATLLSHQRKREWVPKASKNAALEALWAPVMLLHLGGQDGITAFSIEDNELWKRQVLTSVSKIAVAIYVFCKSFSRDIRLFQATILIFVPGILKCLEKPWALYRASIYSMANTSGSEVSEGPSKEKFIDANVKSNYSLDSYVKDAVKYLKDGPQDGDEFPYVIRIPYKLFVDLSYSYEVRLHNLKYMAGKRDNLKNELYYRLFDTFECFYTKRNVYGDTFHGPVVRIVAVFLTFAAIWLFHMCHREAYSNTDVSITYVLLGCTATLEFISACLKPCHLDFLWMTHLSCLDNVAQYNLIWYLASRRKKRGRLLRGLPFLVGCMDRLDRIRRMKPCKGEGITELIHDYMTNGWKKAITNPRTYRDFNDNRGQLTLETYLPKDEGKRKRDQNSEPIIHRSTRMPFDESVLFWHLATDFCFYKDTFPITEATSKCRDMSRKMSNYMAYLEQFYGPK